MHDCGDKDSELLRRLEMLFFAALDTPETKRSAFLDRACGSDSAMRASLEKMLSADHEQRGLIDSPPWSIQRLENHILAAEAFDPLAKAGTRIGKYELLDVIATGGMGMVWRARRADRIVAVKLIRADQDQKATIHRFRLEEKILARLEHPNIARLYDGGTTEHGRPYLVMEFVEGLPITDFARRNELSIEARLKLLQQVCEAVQYAHGSLVLHRDIKPGNILITPGGTPKLLDFGIAKVLDDSEDLGGTMTATNVRVLTPQYASPEQIRGERLSVATDVYSLGVVLYELVVDRLPYETRTGARHEFEHAVMEQEPVRPSAAIRARADWPRSRRLAWARRTRGEIDTICMTALQKTPAHRYRSAFELGEDIRRHLAGTPLLAKPPSALVRFTRTVRRRRAAIVTTLLGAVVGIGLAAAYVVRAFLAPDWQEEHIRRARLAIIGGRENSAIYSVLFYAPYEWSPQKREAHGLSRDEARAAAASYDAAMRWGGVDEQVTMESAMVRLLNALDASAPDIDAEFSRLLQDAPLTRRYLRIMASHEGPRRPGSEEIQNAAVNDLRSLGLFSLFVGDLQTTIDCWSRLPMTDPDPLVECLLGYIHLALDEPELAYPRLLSAYRTYPESSTIALYLADAAVRCGDLAQAEHCLEMASRFGSRDANFGLERVRVLVLLAQGREKQAIELLCLGFCGRSAVAELQLARYFERTYGLEQAIRAIAGRINPFGQPQELERASFEYFVNAMEAWWTQLSPNVQDALARRSTTGVPMDPDAFGMLLQRFRLACKALAPGLQANNEVAHPVQTRARWARLARPLDSFQHDAAREELLGLAGETPEYKWRYSCAEQCLPYLQDGPTAKESEKTQTSSDQP